jgi:hypothetical protein
MRLGKAMASIKRSEKSNMADAEVIVAATVNEMKISLYSSVYFSPNRYVQERSP